MSNLDIFVQLAGVRIIFDGNLRLFEDGLLLGLVVIIQVVCRIVGPRGRIVNFWIDTLSTTIFSCFSIHSKLSFLWPGQPKLYRSPDPPKP